MFDQWSHSFCLTCDKQVEADGSAYCSESCRLTELESTPSSQASSPGLTPSSGPWSMAPRTGHTKFFLPPAYDFANAQPYGRLAVDAPARVLSPSSSNSSLCSLQSTTSTVETAQLSDQARKELLAYAVSFDQVRSHRRRSY